MPAAANRTLKRTAIVAGRRLEADCVQASAAAWDGSSASKAEAAR